MSLSLSERESGLHVESVIFESLAMEVKDSSVSALRSVRGVALAFIADEGEGLKISLFVGLLHHDAALDLAILAKDCLKLLGIVLGVEVLNVDVVVDSAGLTVILGLILDDLDIIQLSSFNGLLHSLLGLEANESVAIGNGRSRDVSLLYNLAIDILSLELG